MPQTLVGNICESGDILARDRELPEVQEGDVLGFLDAGAYCFAMSSNYNQRVRPAEILIDRASKVKLIRRREVPEDLIATVTPLD
jgi:diaminopimelate decarboxylase